MKERRTQNCRVGERGLCPGREVGAHKLKDTGLACAKALWQEKLVQEEGMSRAILESRGNRKVTVAIAREWIERGPKLGRVCVCRAMRVFYQGDIKESCRKQLGNMAAGVGKG